MTSALILPISTINQNINTNIFNKTDIRYKLLRNVFISTFKEIALTTAMTSLTCCFVVSAYIPLLVTSAVTIVGLNILFRLSTALLLFKLNLHDQNKIKNEISLNWLKRSITFIQWLSPCNFALLDFTTTGMLIHETGHALAALVYMKILNLL